MKHPEDIVERLARDFHVVYQQEAKRQGDVRHHDDYDALSENVKEFDRTLARHVIERESQLREVLGRRARAAHAATCKADWSDCQQTGCVEVRALLSETDR